MMLLLSGNQAYYLIPGVDYSVGRRADSDILVLAQSLDGVSRTHGKLSYHGNGELVYTDLSQYGTFIDSQKVGNGESKAVVVGSKLRFGQQSLSWTVEEVKFSMSNIQGKQGAEVVEKVKKLKFVCSMTWDSSCTTLLMNKIFTTVKVINAVANCRDILIPAFLTHIESCIENRCKVENLKKYRPPLASDRSITNVNFTPKQSRKTLFQHLDFVFISPDDVNDSRGLITALGGNVLLLDPLQQDRKSVLLSPSSIVMESKDAALNDYLKSTLSERELLPTKHVDLVLAMFHIDKSRVFKNKPTSDTQVSSVSMQVQNTQAMSQVQPLLCNTQSQNVNINDTSVYQPSALPPKLDVSIETPVKATSVKTHVPQNNATPQKTVDVSYFEPSAIPPRLDKTVASPLPQHNKQTISFIEPSAIPPSLEKSSSTPQLNNYKSVFEPSAVPPNLEKTLESPATFNQRNCPTSTANLPVSRKNNDVSFCVTPVATSSRNSAGSDVSLFGSSTKPATAEQPWFSLGPNKTQSSAQKKAGKGKRVMRPDSDESDDENPFAALNPSKEFSFVNTAFSTSNSDMDSKRPRLEPPAETSTDSVSLAGKSENHETAQTLISPTQETVKIETSPAEDTNDGTESISLKTPTLITSETKIETDKTDPSLKRELLDKQEPANKKFKTESPYSTSSSSSNVTIIPDMTQSVWLSRTPTDHVVRNMNSMTITDFSVDLIVPRTYTHSKMNKDIDTDKSVVNFKRFKKNNVVVRSSNITLCPGLFKKNGGSNSLFDDSDESQGASDDEDDISLFAMTSDDSSKNQSRFFFK